MAELPSSSLAREQNQSTANAPAPLERIGSLRRLAGGGFTWLTLSLVAGRILGVIAQLILGRLLTDADFGIFAIVVSIAALIRVLADGGVPQVLIQRGETEFQRLAGPAFWLTAASSLTVGLMLALAAPALAWFYGAEELTVLLLIVAISLPLTAPGAMMRAKLRISTQFRSLALIAFAWVAIRHITSVSFAMLGLGVMSLVLPLLIAVCFDGLSAYWITRFKPWTFRPHLFEWPGIARSSLWVVCGAGCRALTRTGDYLVLGRLVPDALLGQYYFGYLITSQIVEMIATNLQQVAFPIMSKLAAEPERHSRAILRTIRMLVLVAAPASLALACVVRPTIEILDTYIWQGKWSAAIPLMQIFAVAAPVRMFSEVLNAGLSSRGKFGSAAKLMLLEGVLLMASAFLAVVIAGQNLVGIAAVIAVSQTLFSIAAGTWVLRDFSIRPLEFFSAFLPSSLVATLCGAAVIGATSLLPESASPFVLIALRLALFAALFAVASLIALRGEFADLKSALPAGVARHLSLNRRRP